MNIAENTSNNTNIITNYDNDCISTRDKNFRESFYIFKDKTNTINIKNIGLLNPEHLQPIINDTPPDIIVFGTGKKMERINDKITIMLIEQKINFEFMNTIAGIKTYNALCFDGRNVLGIFII